MPPDGCWDLVFLKRERGMSVLRTGLTTSSVTFDGKAGDEILSVSFGPGTFMPLMPGDEMRDQGIMLDMIGKQRFWLGTEVMEVPGFDDVDAFIRRLFSSGLVHNNPAVAAIAAGHPPAMTERTMQRHFLQTTGLTYKYFTQVQRTQKAMSLLQAGRTAADVAFALGYSDQPHLIRSLKAIIGQTPGQIADKNSKRIAL